MDERHENEQYFFASQTLDHLASFAASFARPCCICAPMVGQRLARAGHPVRILDIDDRFADCAGFVHWDLQRPTWLGEDYDLILCDPPFFNVSLSRLFTALRTLAQHRFDQRLLISYPTRRGDNLLSTFHRFGLQPTGYFPTYLTVKNADRNAIEFYGNLGDDLHQRLRQGDAGRAKP